MLKLDALELIGFKSFPEKMRLQFPAGVTCVIGPNGCGKSNLADAIGWVLGTQSAHSLRGERMEDVIFSGTAKRKPSGFVEATLAFSREDGEPIILTDLDFSGEVLEISRKLYRDGESVYSINQRRCRLKDIHSILEEAGLGFATYAMIAQGRIGWFLSAKSLERRTIIEEAARITGYKSRRRSAQLKLEMAQQNLVRVSDIISEVERQLRSLKRQAAKARRYRRLRQAFRQLQRQRYVLEAEGLRGRVERVNEELSRLKGEEKRVSEELAGQEEAYRVAQQRREELDARLAELRQMLADHRLAVDRAENAIQYHQEQKGALQKSLDTHSGEQRLIEASLEKVDDEMARFAAERESLEAEEKRMSAALEQQGELVRRRELQLRELEARVEDLRNQLVQFTAERTALHNRSEQLEQHLQASEPVIRRLEMERAEHALALQQGQARLQQTGQAMQAKADRIEELKAALQLQEGQKHALEVELSGMQAESAELQSRVIAQRERLQSLQEIESSHSQYSEGVQKFLTHLAGNQGIHADGTLADFIETSPQYERLVEEFLDEELEYILVDSLDEALRGLGELKTLQSGKCTFLTLSSGNGNGNGHSALSFPGPGEGVFGRLADLLQMKPEIQQAFRRVLPERAEAVVVADLNRAVQLAHQYPETTFITLEGEALTSKGLLSASSVAGQKLGLLSLKRQKRELEERVEQLQTRFSSAREREREKKAALSQAVSLFEEQEGALHQSEKELIALTHQRQHWEGEVERQQRALRVVQEELKELERECREQRHQLQEVARQLTEKEAARTETEALLAENQNALQQLRSELAHMQEHLHLMASDRKVLEERRTALQRTLGRIEEQRAGLESRRQVSQLAQVQARERLQEVEEVLRLLEVELNKHRAQTGETATRLQETETDYAAWRERSPESERLLKELRERKAALQEERSQHDVEQARLDTQLQNIAQQCWDQLQLSLEKAAQELDPKALDREAVMREHQQLKERLEKFGPINMAALQEYQENEERHAFLTTQRQDIETSIADTTRTIDEINRRSRDQFREAFEAINRNFNTIFQTLFGGGESGMQLLDDGDPLESGIDIFAQPPGKKLQNVMLLSGGEKAMTVFALLMALFRYRPSRFCLLDEVDAPLDDANVGRFNDLVRQLSDTTQFIVITHNKRTMETAETLYGVTMEEPGVSKIVSVQF